MMAEPDEDTDVDGLVAEYSQLISEFGLDSPQVEEFYSEHAKDVEFQELATVVGELRRTHADKEQARREAARLSRKSRILTASVATLLLFVVVFGTVSYLSHKRSEWLLAEKQLELAAKDIELKQLSIDVLETTGDTKQLVAVRESRLNVRGTSNGMYRPMSPPPVPKEPAALVEKLVALPDDAPDKELRNLNREVIYAWAKAPAAGGDTESAIVRFKRVADLHPEWSRPAYALGVLQHDEDPQAASICYERAWQLNQRESEKQPMAANNLAMLKLKKAEQLRESGNKSDEYTKLLEGAQDLARQALEIAPGNYAVLDTEAQVFLELAESAEPAQKNDWRKKAVARYQEAEKHCTQPEVIPLFQRNITELNAKINK